MTDYDLPDELTVTEDGPVRIVTLNRPDELNAVNRPLHRALHSVWRQIDEDRDAAVVVLTGAGRAFCAGGDFNFVKTTHVEREARLDLSREAFRIVQEMLHFRAPIIAAVNGPAVGLGTTLALASDVVLLSEKSFLQDPHVSIGLTAGDGGTILWPLYTSLMRAKEYLFTGDRVYPEDAMRIGIANRIVPQADIMTDALALAHRMAAQPRRALQFTKRALNMQAERSALAVGDFAWMAEAMDMGSDEHKKAIRDFLGHDAYDAIEISPWEG